VDVPEVLNSPSVSLSNMPATPQQRRIVFAIAALLLAGFGIAAPFGGAKLPQFVSFNPTVEAMVFVNDLVTAIFLFSQYAISRSRAILALAIGYFYTALIVVPYALAYPGAFTGLLNTGPQSSAYLYYFWIVGTPLGAIPYALLSTAHGTKSQNQGSARPAIVWSVSLVIVLVYGISWIATTGSWLLPPLMEGNRYTYAVIYIGTPLSILVTVIALALLWFRRRSVLNYWLMLVMLSLLLNHVIADFLGGERYSLGFYVSRGFTLCTSMLVLGLLLWETTSIYARLARSNAMLQRERDNKLMNLQAVVASISHEIKQPLAAVIANTEAALIFLGKAPPDLGEVQSALNDVISDTHRANEVLEGIRVLFGKAGQEQEPIDINDTAHEALRLLHGELKDHGVTTHFDLASELPFVMGHRGQLREVVLNLVHNAVEAMGNVAEGSRLLQVTTQRRDADAIVLAVRDTGPGIDPKQLTGIFDAFFTTKSHGMGLGLAICRAIIEGHGGQLTAFSDGKRGALFQFVLPITSMSEGAATGK
jgi:signal transduction histidine kinase